jgi:hypothetical protein
MQNIQEDRAQAIALRLSQMLDDEAASAVLAWASELRDIRESDLSLAAKGRKAMRTSLDPRFLKIVLHVIGDAVAEGSSTAKKLAWDDRGWPARLGLVGVAAALATFGSQGAGIAALGSAVGVPLWLVLGAGGTFLGTIIGELTKRTDVGR